MRTDSGKYGIGVALSGGGARGFAHLGALKALIDAGIRIDAVAGVSAGSVASVVFSAGVSIDEIMEEFGRRKFSDFVEYNFRFNRKSGLFSLDRFEAFIEETVAPYKRLEELPVPTYIGVTDFDGGTQAEFHKGPIAPIVVASCSIPICFPPREIEGKRYVDGGVVRNMPAWILREKCRFLIGINCSPILRQDSVNVTSLPEIAIRTFHLMAKANQKQDLEMCDLAIEFPEIANYKVFDLKHIKDVFLRGYTVMRHGLRQNSTLEKLLKIQKEGENPE